MQNNILKIQQRYNQNQAAVDFFVIFTLILCAVELFNPCFSGSIKHADIKSKSVSHCSIKDNMTAVILPSLLRLMRLYD